MNKDILIFLKRAALFIVLMVLVDKLLGNLLAFSFLNMKKGEPARISYAINNAEQDLLIFGSSKANHHYIPAVFEKNFHLSAYNAGIDGQRILYDYCVLRSVLARKAPKIVILDLHPNEFDNSEITYNGLSVLLPYYKSHDQIQPIVNLRSPYEKYKAFSDLYRYNSLIFTIVVNNLVDKKDTTINGYYPFYNVWNHPLGNESPVAGNDKTDSTKIKYFRSFIREARSAGARVFVFVSPVFRKTNGETVSMKIAKDICGQENILFRDYSQYPEFLEHADYFQDPSHLNNVGATIYSNLVSHDIASF